MNKFFSNSLTIALLIVAGLLILRTLVGPSVAETPAVLTGSSDLNAAIERAEDEDKVVFAVASAPWCGPCQSYKRSTLADESVQSWIRDNAVGIHINVDEDREAAARLQVRSIPATFVIKDGTIVNKFTGAVSKDRLMRTLEPYTLATAAK